ncbi:MAG: helix-turn-helix domain-containing protein, partial [Gemmatimonadales bacterium]
PWPGNVRELSHVIERAVLWSRDTSLNVEHLSVSAPMGMAGERPDLAVDREPPIESGDLTQVERSMIERAMREAGGNQTRAAQRLGISRDTLRYRLKKFGIGAG